MVKYTVLPQISILISTLSVYPVDYFEVKYEIEDELNAVESVRNFLVYLDDHQQIEIEKIKRAIANM
jgi:hypothetical protein